MGSQRRKAARNPSSVKKVSSQVTAEGKGKKIGNSISYTILFAKLYRSLCKNWIMMAVMVGMGILLLVFSFTRPKRRSPIDTSSKIPSSYKVPLEPIAVYPDFAVLEVLPHDPKAFTQGLTFNGTALWEGTGMYGNSELRRIHPQTGKVLDSHSLNPSVFGEGITWYVTKSGHSRLIQITWRERRGWTYDANTLRPVLHHSNDKDEDDKNDDAEKGWTYETSTGEGWGITYDPVRHSFWVTDGSSIIHEWDAETRKEKQRLTVVTFSDVDGRRIPVNKLNEIEYIGNNRILSNVWYEDIIVKIHLETGIVEQIYDFSPLYVNRAEGTDCFNGISVTEIDDEFWVTGKYWPHMYRVRLLL
jgi:glutaminyl-peptide cyclotransferase